MLIVLDTSVLIAFLLSRGRNNCQKIIHLAKKKHIRLVASKETIRELKRVLSLSTVKGLPGYKAHIIASFVAWYQHNVEYFSINNIPLKQVIRDKNDTVFLRLAVTSRAKYIITGDEDILTIKKIEKTLIISTSQFFELEKQL